MNDVDKVGVVFADPAMSVRSVEQRLCRIQRSDPSDAAETGFSDGPSDVTGNVRSEAVSDDVDLSRIKSGFPNQARQKFSDVLSDGDDVAGGLRVAVDLRQAAPVDGHDVVVTGLEVLWKLRKVPFLKVNLTFLALYDDLQS